MKRNREKVLQKLDKIRENARDYFIPLGSLHDDTEAKRDISNLAETLNARIPLVGEFVKAASNHPVYVGYDGLDGENLGSYSNNIIRLSQRADEDSEIFIRVYAHELTHMDQDRRKLLRMNDAPPPLNSFISFIAHYLSLEAAAIASEITCTYFFSDDPVLENRAAKTLSEEHPDIASYFQNLLSQSETKSIAMQVLCKVDGRDIRDKEVFKDAWRSAFQAFFDPDSAFLKRYVSYFCNSYIERAEEANKTKGFSSEHGWAGLKELKAITTLPGLGSIYTDEALDVLRQTIFSSVMQEKYSDIIEISKSQATKLYDKDRERNNYFAQSPS